MRNAGNVEGPGRQRRGGIIQIGIYVCALQRLAVGPCQKTIVSPDWNCSGPACVVLEPLDCPVLPACFNISAGSLAPPVLRKLFHGTGRCCAVTRITRPWPLWCPRGRRMIT